MSQSRRDPALVQCNDCGGMTESAHEYAKISFLKTRAWRCPECYHDWRRSDTKQRGHWVTCQVPRCDAPRLHGDSVREVCDPVTSAVAFVCPYHFDQAQAARLHHGRMVDAQRAKDITAAVTDAVSKASAPRTLITPGNPDGIKHIAATLAVIAPDLNDAEVAAVAESLYGMAQPVFRVPAFADPGDADPKALDHTCDTDPVKFCVACIQGIHAVDYLDLMRVHRRGDSVAIDSLADYQRRIMNDVLDRCGTPDELRALVYGEPGRLKGALRGARVSYIDMDEVQDQP